VPKQEVGAQRIVLIRAHKPRNKTLSCIGQFQPQPLCSRGQLDPCHAILRLSLGVVPPLQPPPGLPHRVQSIRGGPRPGPGVQSILGGPRHGPGVESILGGPGVQSILGGLWPGPRGGELGGQSAAVPVVEHAGAVLDRVKQRRLGHLRR